MDFKGNLGDIMKQAQEMQTRMQQAQQELAELTVIGEAGAGLVKVTMNGRHDVKKVDINDNLQEEDMEMIEDLTAAAFNDAVRKVEQKTKSKIMDLTSGLEIPDELQGIAGGDDKGGQDK